MTGAPLPADPAARLDRRGVSRRPILGASLAVFAAAASEALSFESWSGVEVAAEREGEAVVYSTLPDQAWPALVEAFAALHPKVRLRPERVASIAGLVARYREEARSGAPTADVLFVNAVEDWAQLSAESRLTAFDPPDARGLPAYARTADTFAFALEPQAFFFNRAALAPEHRPKGLADLAATAAAVPEILGGRIVGYDPFASPFAMEVLWALARRQGDAFWTSLTMLAPHLRLEAAAPAMMARIASGEAVVSLYLPETFAPRAGTPEAAAVGRVRPADGAPVYPRAMAVTREARHPNAGKLLVDFLVSPRGQAAVARSGAMAWRAGVARATGLETFETYRQAMSGRIVLIERDPRFAAARDIFGARLRAVLQRA